MLPQLHFSGMSVHLHGSVEMELVTKWNQPNNIAWCSQYPFALVSQKQMHNPTNAVQVSGHTR